MKTILATMILAATFAGCATSGKKIDTAKLDRIHKGESTQADVLALIGKPDTLMTSTDGNTVLSYHYFQAVADGKQWIPFAGPFIGGVDTSGETVTISIGADGRVSRIDRTETNSHVGGGAAPTR